MTCEFGPPPDDTASAAIERTADELARLPGVAAVALGGSRARGVAAAGSDIDLGVYYRADRRPDYDALVALAAGLDDRGRVTGGGRYGEWGPWINGGVWLQVDGIKTDLLLRDVDRVAAVVDDCAQGRIEVAYQAGHPHAFVSAIYAAEVAHNVALRDPYGLLGRLRSLVVPYPERLARALVRRFDWEVGFAIETAGGAAARGDVAYVAGCAFRAVACMVQVLHAINRVYLTNEKGGVRAVEAMPAKPAEFGRRVAAALGDLQPDPDALAGALRGLGALRHESSALAAPLLDDEDARRP